MLFKRTSYKRNVLVTTAVVMFTNLEWSPECSKGLTYMYIHFGAHSDAQCSAPWHSLDAMVPILKYF